MKPIEVPQSTSYIACFLSLACNLSCSYCINHTSGLNSKRKHLSAEEWIIGLNRINANFDLPLSLQGGEPSIHKGFNEILLGLKVDASIDLLTNLQFDVETFSQKIPVSRFERDLPYPAIRVSYHPETMLFDPLFKKILFLHERGYSIGLFSVSHPMYADEIEKAKKVCNDYGVIFKEKELLGTYNGKKFGTLAYEDSCFQKHLKSCVCKTTELLIAPDGHIFKCHHDLYNAIDPIGHLLDDDFAIEQKFRSCDYYGNCNPCDVKVKNNRFQQFGYSAVTIKDIR